MYTANVLLKLKKLFKEFSMTSNESQYKLYLYKSKYAIA